MNILLFGDLHARMSQGANLKPLVTDLDLSFMSSRLQVVIKTLEWMRGVIKKHDVRKVICLGDIYEHVGVDTYTRNIIYDTLGSIARIVKDEWVTVTGNHDASSSSDPFDSVLFSHNAYSEIVFGNYFLEYLQSINSVFVYVPYFLSKKKLIHIYKEIHKELEKYPKKVKKYLFSHHNIKELISFGQSPNSEELGLEKFDKCFFGHIHYKKESKNIKSIGGVITDSFNDLEDIDRGVTILKVDGRDFKEIFVPNPHSPYYTRLSTEDFKGKQEKLEIIRKLKEEGRKVYSEFVEVSGSTISEYSYLFDLISIVSDVNKDPVRVGESNLNSEALEDWKSYLSDRFDEFLVNTHPDESKFHKTISKMFVSYLDKAENLE